jgi:hypothetical protein
MTLSLTTEILDELYTHVYKESIASDELILWCPFCDDKLRHDHGHLYLNKTTQKWHCFSCDKGGRDIGYLLKSYGINVSYIDTAKWIVEQYVKPGVSILTKPEQDADDINRYEELRKQFLEEAYDINKSSQAYKYLNIKRKLSSKEIDKSWRLWDKYPGYVFWFCTDSTDGSILFYSGRAYMPHTERRLRYMHAPSSQVPLVLLNSEKTLNSPSTMRQCVFIVEGIFDALLAPGPAIPVFSKAISSGVMSTLSALLKHNDYAVICTPDKGELEAALKMADTLNCHGISEIYLFDIRPYKDFGVGGFKDITDMTKIYNKMILYHSHLEDILRVQFS